MPRSDAAPRSVPGSASALSKAGPVRPCLDRLCGTGQPDHAHAGPPRHAADRCVFEEDREPCPQRAAALQALQFLPPAYESGRDRPARAAGVTDRI